MTQSHKMKKTYHLCLSAGNEIMFRDTEDYNRGFNCFALALYHTDSTGLCESFMSTHTHQVVRTSTAKGLMAYFRHSYSAYFNHKYKRRGKLGEREHFCLEIEGYHHLIAAMSYTLRNPVHHGVAPIPYAYPHCSANAIFRKEMGKFADDVFLPTRSYSKHIGRRATFPPDYKMNESGLFVRESVLDIPQVENLYVTPRTFNYYMSRKSSEEWEAEQTKDQNERPAVNISAIENGVVTLPLEKMLYYESGKADYRKISDIELCTYLDSLAKTVYGRHSVYQLTRHEKENIAEELYRKHHLSDSQIRRCLAFQ